MRAFVLAVCAICLGGCPNPVIVERIFGEPTLLTLEDGEWVESTLLKIALTRGPDQSVGYRWSMKSLRVLLISLTIGMVASADDGGVPLVPTASRRAVAGMLKSGYRPGPRTTIQAVNAPSEFLVERLVLRHFGELESCWNGLTSAQRPRSVEAKLTLTVGKEQKIAATLTPPGPLNACVLERVSKWRLSEPTPEGSTGSVTFLFSLK